MKLFGKDKNKDKDGDEEKPIVFYYAKYVGVLGSDKSLPVDEGSYVYLFEDKIVVELLKSKIRITIPYRNMTDLQNVDAGNKVDLDRVVGLSLASLGVGTLIGLLWKRHHIVSIIKYIDDDHVSQIIALDFLGNTQYAQPIIDRKLREVQPKFPHDNTSQVVGSIADELSKIAKLKEQGVITEEEFLQMKNNLLNQQTK
jgi:Short C-terminal domain